MIGKIKLCYEYYKLNNKKEEEYKSYREVPNLRHKSVLKNGTRASKKCII